MKALVAGKGFIGSAVGEKLDGRGHEVKYLDRSGGDYRQDITGEFSIDEEFDVLVHAIGLAPGFSSAEQYREVHVEGTANLLDAVDCEKVVFISALGAGEVDHSFFRTKSEAEQMVRESEPGHAIVRPSTVYGEGNRLLDMIRGLSWTRIFPDLGVRAQPILLDDLAGMVAEIASGDQEGLFRAAGPEKLELGELAERIYAQEGCRCFRVPYPRFLLELKLLGLSFLPPPFERENIRILRHDNTTDENDAPRFVELGEVPGGG